MRIAGKTVARPDQEYRSRRPNFTPWHGMRTSLATPNMVGAGRWPGGWLGPTGRESRASKDQAPCSLISAARYREVKACKTLRGLDFHVDDPEEGLP